MTEAAPRLDRAGQHLLRDLAPQVLGVVMRRFRDFPAAEDAVQEALIAASTQWPREGLPESPQAWLVHVASRRVTDHVRAEAARRHREALVVSLIPFEDQLALAADEAGVSGRDDTLDLLFMCCHPSLSTTSAIALTLRAVAGLTTAEIGAAFLVPEATMAQRISRAKQTIKSSGVPFELPNAAERAARLGAVKHVVYLVFNEGYTATSGPDLARTDMSSEAIRLARMLHEMLPDDAEVAGLLALLLLTDARRRARTGPCGELIPLDEQDRTLWDAEQIAEGVALVTTTLSRGQLGEYQVQAAIAAIHDEARSTEATDWPQILGLYEILAQLTESPMVRLNQAIALAMVRGPEAGLAQLAALETDARLANNHRLFAARAHLLERAGDRMGAVAAFHHAADITTSVIERNYMLTRAARLRDEG